MKVILTLGSNTPDCQAQLVRAIAWLNRQLTDLRVSPIYMTPPLSGLGRDYANAVAIGELATPPASPDQFNQSLKAYELSQGRTPEARSRGEVAIDVDLIFWGANCLRPAEITRDYYRRGARSLGI